MNICWFVWDQSASIGLKPTGGKKPAVDPDVSGKHGEAGIMPPNCTCAGYRV